MRFVGSWATEGSLSFVHLEPEVLETFNEYVQGVRDLESGGILLGCVRGPHLQIIEATTPSPKDRRSRFSFERDDFHHYSTAMKRWEESNGIIRYIGEWHTHPEDYPSPSSIDLREWRALAASRIDGRPLLALIVGRKGLHLEFMRGNGTRVRLCEGSTSPE
jgi:integrative and conjugative element protein (TIGR02256 family)